jgi:hypothetical protein
MNRHLCMGLRDDLPGGKKMKRFTLLLYIVVSAIFLIACNLITPRTDQTITATPQEHPADKIAAPVSTNTPTTEIPSPAPSDLPASDTSTPQPLAPIVYYYFVPEDESPPAGSVVILPDILILGLTQSDVASNPEIATNISSALQAVINDPRNAWTSTDLDITSITLNEGVANVALQGDYFGAGDIVLIAARNQILLTIFAEPSIQSAIITINGKNIANLGSSDPFTVQPADFSYTRAEIETFITENAYKMP